MVVASDELDQYAMRRKLQDILDENHLDADDFIKKEKTFREILREAGADLGQQVILSALEQIPLVGSGLSKSAERLMKEITKKYRPKKD